MLFLILSHTDVSSAGAGAGAESKPAQTVFEVEHIYVKVSSYGTLIIARPDSTVFAFSGGDSPMAFKLYGEPVSSCTRRMAVIIAKRRGLQYDLILVDIKVVEQRQSPHSQHLPYGRIPYITVQYVRVSHFSLHLRIIVAR